MHARAYNINNHQHLILYRNRLAHLEHACLAHRSSPMHIAFRIFLDFTQFIPLALFATLTRLPLLTVRWQRQRVDCMASANISKFN